MKLERPIRRVAFTCDIMRLVGGTDGLRNVQQGNLRWLRELLTQAPVWSSTGLEVSTVVPPVGQDALREAVGNPTVWADYLDDPELAWARRFEAAEPDLFAPLLRTLLDHDLVVGFELPPVIKTYLHQAGRPYVSLHIDPLRFLRDICLGATTNCAEIAAALQAHAVPADEVIQQVARFRAQFARVERAEFAFPRDVPVLIGQTERDSILIEHGRFCDWAEKFEQLGAVIGAHDTVIFVEHPLRSSSVVPAQWIRAVGNRNVILTNVNGYGLLFSNPDLPFVVTLASSLAVEAQALGLDAHFLLGNPRERVVVPGVDIGLPQPLGHGILGERFWAHLLGRSRTVPNARGRAAPLTFEFGDNYLRSSLESWSYRIFLNGTQGAVTRKVLLPSASLAAPRRDQLIDALCGSELSSLARTGGGCDLTALSKHGLELHLAAAPIDLGDSRAVDVRNPWEPLAIEHFEAPEGWGVWMTGDHGRIRLAISPDAVASRATVTVRMGLQPFEAVVARCPVVRIAVDGLDCAHVFYRPSGPRPDEVVISFEAKNTMATIELYASDALTPSEVGEGPDPRLLSIAVLSLHVSCTAATDVNPIRLRLPACKLWGISPPPVADARSAS